MNRLGWIATLVVGFLYLSGEDRKPTPQPVIPTPPVIVDVNPPTVVPPQPSPTPLPDEKQKLIDRLEGILGTLDIEALETLHKKIATVDVAKLEKMIDLLNRYGDKPGGTPAPPPKLAETEKTICRCQGHKRGDCLCLKAGVTCHCSQTSGSIWEKVNQKWLKTTAKADPRKPLSQPVQSLPSSGPGEGYEVTQEGNTLYWWVDGVRWSNQGAQAYEGVEYVSGNNRFQYLNGRMYLNSSQAPAASQPKFVPNMQPTQFGRWVCRGGQCYWVSNN